MQSNISIMIKKWVDTTGKRIKDLCTTEYENNFPSTPFSTLTREECIHTCESKIVTGCEYRSEKAECLFHTKIVLGARYGAWANDRCLKFKLGKESCSYFSSQWYNYI